MKKHLSLALAIVLALTLTLPIGSSAYDPLIDYQNGALPNLKHVYARLSPPQVMALFSAPFVLVPAMPGKIILPTNMHIRKTVGTAYTTTGSGVLRVRWMVTNGANQFAIFDQAATTAFFGAGEAVWVGEAGKGQFWGIGDTTGGNFSNGAALALDLASADITVGTGELIVNIWYREWEGL